MAAPRISKIEIEDDLAGQDRGAIEVTLTLSDGGRRWCFFMTPAALETCGDWIDGKISENPADLVNAWKIQTVLCEHELPGTAKHDPLAYLQNRTVDWLDHQLAARELLDFDVANTPLIVEHEYPAARVQDKEALAPILKGSIAFTRYIDQAAAAMYSLQNEVLAAQGIPVQGIGREAYRS